MAAEGPTELVSGGGKGGQAGGERRSIHADWHQEADTGASFTGSAPAAAGSSAGRLWRGGRVSPWVDFYTPFIQIMFPAPRKSRCELNSAGRV